MSIIGNCRYSGDLITLSQQKNSACNSAEEAAKEKGLSNIEYLIEDVHDMHFADSYFDIVVSRFAAHHLSGIEKAPSEMCRVLKPGGKFYILDCSAVDGDEPEREMNRIELLRDSSHQCSRSPRLWKQLLACLPLAAQHMTLYKEQYGLPEWFDRMGTVQNKRSEIFRILNNLSTDCKSQYSFGDDFMTTYRIELLATKT